MSFSINPISPSPKISEPPSKISLTSLIEDPSTSKDAFYGMLVTEHATKADGDCDTFVLEFDKQTILKNFCIIQAIEDIFNESNLKKIKFKNCEFSLITWYLVIKFLSQLDSLAFENCNLSYTHLTALFNATDLNLKSFALTKQEIDGISLFEILQYKKLNQLILDESKLDDKISGLLCHLLKDCLHLQSLHLNHNLFTDFGAGELIAWAVKHVALTELRLDHNAIDVARLPFYQKLVKDTNPKLTVSMEEIIQTHQDGIRAKGEAALFAPKEEILTSRNKDESIYCSPLADKLEQLLTEPIRQLQEEIKKAAHPTFELLQKIYSCFYANSDTKEELFSDFLAKDFEKHSVLADGNCLFSSITFLLEREYPHQLNYVMCQLIHENKKLYSVAHHYYHLACKSQLLRLAAVDYMRANPEEFSPFIGTRESETNKDAFESYCKKMEERTTWGSDIEIKAICGVFAKAGIPLPPLVLLDVTKEPYYYAGEFIVPNLLNIESGVKVPSFYIHRERQNHFYPLTKRERKQTLETKPMETDVDEIANTPLGIIIKELKNNYNYHLHFVISQYLMKNKADFETEILNYNENNFSALLKKIITHYKKNHSAEFKEIQPEDDLILITKVFEAMGEPIIIRIYDATDKSLNQQYGNQSIECVINLSSSNGNLQLMDLNTESGEIVDESKILNVIPDLI